MKLQTSLLYISIVISKKYVSTNCTELSFWEKMALTILFIVNVNVKKKKNAFFQIIKSKIYPLQHNKHFNKILPIQNRNSLLSIFSFMWVK